MGYLGKQKKRNADLGESILNKIIENCPEINPEWLLTGKGEMLKEITLLVEDTIPILNEEMVKNKLIVMQEKEIVRLEKENKILDKENVTLKELLVIERDETKKGSS